MIYTNIDAELSNSDWSKVSFDFPEIKTASQLVDMLDELGISDGHFMALPVYQINKDSDLLVAWLKLRESTASKSVVSGITWREFRCPSCHKLISKRTVAGSLQWCRNCKQEHEVD